MGAATRADAEPIPDAGRHSPRAGPKVFVGDPRSSTVAPIQSRICLPFAPMLRITPSIAIPEDELEERFVRSSGPGGQNVNKVATAVELRFDAAQSDALPAALKARLLARRDSRITEDGVVIIQAQRFRSQDRNREDARERLLGLIIAVLKPPKPRIATKPSRGAQERRLSSKRERAGIKRPRAARALDTD